MCVHVWVCACYKCSILTCRPLHLSIIHENVRLTQHLVRLIVGVHMNLDIANNMRQVCVVCGVWCVVCVCDVRCVMCGVWCVCVALFRACV